MRLLIAGGGTGGHLFPGIAIAEEVARRGPSEILFVGTSRGIEVRAVPAAGYALETLQVSGLKRMGFLGTLRGLSRLPLALLRSLTLVRRFRPDAVVGVGGYASGPVVLAAWLLGYATAIQEQNSVPGITNRVLGRLVRLVFTAFEDAARSFPSAKVAKLGNPVRRSIVSSLQQLESTETSQGALRILVVGGSQGARAVNELMAEAAGKLAGMAVGFKIVHQTGNTDLQRMGERYAAVGLSDRVETKAFIDDMAAAYGAADLVVARAGALTLAELAISGRPAILVPLPTAADDHQTKNASRFAQEGAAIVVDQRAATADRLAATIAELARDRSRRVRMALAMRAMARPDAAKDIVDRLSALRA